MNGLGGAGRLNPRARLLSSVLPSPIPLCILSLLSSTQPSHLLSSTPFCSFDVSLVVLLLALLGRNSAFVLPTNRRVRRCGDGRGASQPAAAAGHRHSPPDAVRIALAPHSASTAARCTTHSTAHPPLPPARRLVCSRALAFPFPFSFLLPRHGADPQRRRPAAVLVSHRQCRGMIGSEGCGSGSHCSPAHCLNGRLTLLCLCLRRPLPPPAAPLRRRRRRTTSSMISETSQLTTLLLSPHTRRQCTCTRNSPQTMMQLALRDPGCRARSLICSCCSCLVRYRTLIQCRLRVDHSRTRSR